MRCKNCNKEIKEDELFCENCGMRTKVSKNNINKNAYVELDDEVDGLVKFGYGAMGFFFPLVGLILFLVWRQTKPVQSKAVGIGALIKLGVGLILFIIVLTYAYYNMPKM